MRLIVTGGAGFIGSAFVRMILRERAVTRLVNIDKLTYAGNLDNVAEAGADARYRFVHGDVCDGEMVEQIFAEESPDAVLHFAAESHVDRSILTPLPFFESNLRGTFTLLEAARIHKTPRFIHISTDEVYGSIDEPMEANESFPLRPSSPYAASKAGSDLLALSHHATYGVPVIVTRTCNNYGPCQFPEKLIPLMIAKGFAGLAMPIYGDGLQVRDWIYVDDHCRAIRLLLDRGRPGQIYNIGANSRLCNRDVVRQILTAAGGTESLIKFVEDRPGHDRRYAVCSDKVSGETGWAPQVSFTDGLRRTIQWYRENDDWLRRAHSDDCHQAFSKQQYSRRA